MNKEQLAIKATIQNSPDLNISGLKSISNVADLGSIRLPHSSYTNTSSRVSRAIPDFRVISNKIEPTSYNPVPSFKMQDTIYVAILNDQLGFTAQRIKADNRQERLNQIHRAWNIQVLKDFWTAIVAHPLPEEEIFLEFGLIIACRKLVIHSAGESQEIWDTTVWKVAEGKIEAFHQFISKQEPTPVIIKTANGMKQKVFLLNEKQALTFNAAKHELELMEITDLDSILASEDDLQALELNTKMVA